MSYDSKKKRAGQSQYLYCSICSSIQMCPPFYQHKIFEILNFVFIIWCLFFIVLLHMYKFWKSCIVLHIFHFIQMVSNCINLSATCFIIFSQLLYLWDAIAIVPLFVLPLFCCLNISQFIPAFSCQWIFVFSLFFGSAMSAAGEIVMCIHYIISSSR